MTLNRRALILSAGASALAWKSSPRPAGGEGPTGASWLDRAALPPGERVGYDAILYALQTQAAIDGFGYGGASATASPYVLSQQTGAYQDIPDFLDTKHLIDTAADADAYLARLNAFARQLDDDTEAFRRETGDAPPDFILDLTLEQLGKTLTAPESSLLVTSIARRAAARGLPARYGEDAAKLYVEAVAPALQGSRRVRAWYRAGLRAAQLPDARRRRRVRKWMVYAKPPLDYADHGNTALGARFAMVLGHDMVLAWAHPARPAGTISPLPSTMRMRSVASHS